MKISLLVIFTALLISSCATQRSTPAPENQAAAATDALDDYEGVAEVSDPIEPLNRATFVFNDKLYSWVFTPISKTYTTVLPSPVRQGIDNVYENIKFPVRFVNSGLQGNFKRAGQELQKFGVNTFAGFGGLIKQSDRIPSLKDVPLEDSGQTLATWGMGHGPYIVLPILGPCTARETLGLVGDYALNPVNWTFALGENAEKWAWIPSTGNTVRSLPDQLSKYNDSKANAIDPYTAVKSTYIQNRNNAANQ
jgi:phospholipid-binding lipoprotein MlaA